MADVANSPRQHCAATALHPLLHTLHRLGVDTDSLLARIGLDATRLEQPELRIRQACYHDAWRAAEEISGDPAIGLRVIEHFDLSKISLFTYLASASDTPREAHERARRYIGIVHEALEVELRVEGDRSICETRFRGYDSCRALADFAVGLLIKAAPTIVGTPPPMIACFIHSRPDYHEEYARVLGVPTRFDTHFNGISSPAIGLDRKLPRSDPALCALLEEHADSLLANVPSISCFADQVRHQIGSALPKGDSSAEGVASALGMSARTLRRRLRDAGVNHQQLLDEVRCGLAQRALARPELSIGEVAYLLGFSDASAFHKAYRRWTGRSPTHEAS